MYSVNARSNERSPSRTSLERHSCVTERTHLSANAFRFGLRGGIFKHYAFRRQHIVEGGTEFRISVMQHVAALTESASRVVDGVARHLSDPRFCGVACDASERDAPGLQMNEEQDVVGGEPTPSQNFDGEEVGSRKHSHVCGDEVFPGRGLAAFGRGWDAVALQHVSDSLVRHVVAEISEGASQPIVPPGAVLLGHADDERLDLRADSRPSWIRAMLRSIELASDETPTPGENRFGFRDTGHLRKKLPPKAFADLSQRASLGVGEPNLAGQMRAQNPIFCDEVFALEKQAVIHEARYVCQQLCPAIVLHVESTWYRRPTVRAGRVFWPNEEHFPATRSNARPAMTRIPPELSLAANTLHDEMEPADHFDALQQARHRR